MINITEEQRDKLLDLCQTSKEVSLDYDKVTEINDSINSLPQYLLEKYDIPSIDGLGENIDDKLNNINIYINEEIIEPRPAWYMDILNDIELMYQMIGDTYSNDTRIKEAIVAIQADYGRDFIKR